MSVTELLLSAEAPPAPAEPPPEPQPLRGFAVPKGPVFAFNLRTREQYSDFCWFEGAFSREDVERILDHAAAAPVETGTVGLDHAVDGGIRRSVVRWLYPSGDNTWLFSRLTDLLWNCNEVRYGFDLSGLVEGLQVSEYGPGGFYGWHKDHGNGRHSIRKLSLTLQLSEPDEYDGGAMEFLCAPSVASVPRGLGTAVVFPSYVMHRVQPVTSGVRRSLVAWVSGAPYR